VTRSRWVVIAVSLLGAAPAGCSRELRRSGGSTDESSTSQPSSTASDTGAAPASQPVATASSDAGQGGGSPAWRADGESAGDVAGSAQPDAGADSERVVARMRPRFRHCYQVGLEKTPGAAGQVTLNAKIGPRGEVQSVQSVGGQSLGPILGCLKAVVLSGQFPPPVGGSASVSIPLTFVSQK
jgi:hypothetical protein